MKLAGKMYWAVTKVNVLSLEIPNIVEVDVFIITKDRMCDDEMASHHCSTGV